MKRIFLLFAVIAGITSPNISQTVTDIDGNVYHSGKVRVAKFIKE